VLLAHGFASSFERNWREPGFVDLLHEAGRTVVPFDFLGHGEAEKPHEPGAYDDLAGALLAAMPEEPTDVIGFSMGALVSLRVASEHPDRFHRLVVAGVGESVFSHASSEATASAIESGHAEEGDVIGNLLVQFSKAPGNDPVALAACLRRMRRPMTVEDLAHVTCPTLVILGDKDVAGPPDRLIAALPDARLVVLRNTEHYATPRSFAFLTAALDFLGANV
jgi:pimeloyl-ACP methyl ester carboxylesterase